MNPVLLNLTKLRSLMQQHDLDVYLVPSSDPHLSEYVADHYKSRAFITGFTGSAGTFVVTKDFAGLFTDGRYFIQAEKELEGSNIHLFKMGEAGVPTLTKWLQDTLHQGMTLGYDGRLFSYSSLKDLRVKLDGRQLTYRPDLDLVGDLWQDRPSLPKDPVWLHDLKYAGKPAKEKLELVRQKMTEKQTDTYLISALADIAWLFNFRGHDVLYTPVAYAYALVTDMSATLYIDTEKLTKDQIYHFHEEGLQVKPYDTYYEDLLTLEGKKIYVDPEKINDLMAASILDNNLIVEGMDLTYDIKACFSDREIVNLKQAQIRDGVAMVEFLYWLDQLESYESINELDVAQAILEARQRQAHFIEPSFETIPAYGKNAAMMHYSASPSNHAYLAPHSFLLVDSGGQYLDGTTDITRTIALGPLTDEEMRDYTLVLRGHIQLARAIFMDGVSGSNLDILARQAIWEAGMDYKSGTGHGIGYVLGVHEGPARIRKDQSNVVLKPGMILTNEPGIYKQDRHGIRIENTLLVAPHTTNEHGIFYHFETISLCPIDLKPVIKDLLDEKDITWLNAFHQTCYDLLAPHLGDQEAAWLKDKTRAL